MKCRVYLYMLFGLSILLITIFFLRVMGKQGLLEQCANDNYKDTELPAFLGEIWPAPGMEITLTCYEESTQIRRGVGVEILVAKTDVFPPPPGSVNADTLPSRTTLFIDDEIILPEALVDVRATAMLVQYRDESGKMIPIGPSSYSLTWSPDLAPGEHTARIEIVNNKNITLEYSWSFRIAR